MRGTLDIKQQGRNQNSYTGSEQEKVEQEQLCGLEVLDAVGFDVFFDQHMGRRGAQAAGMEGADAHFYEVSHFHQQVSVSVSSYLYLVLSALLLSFHSPFPALLPHLCICLLLNLVLSLFFCFLVSFPFGDTIFVLGCAIYIF